MLKIIELLKNEEFRLQLGRGARKYAEQKSCDGVMSGLVKDYEAVISQRQILVS